MSESSAVGNRDALLNDLEAELLAHGLRSALGRAVRVVVLPSAAGAEAEDTARIRVPADTAPEVPAGGDAGAASAGSGSWLPLLTALDVSSVVAYAFSEEVLSAPPPEAREEDGEIQVDIEFDEEEEPASDSTAAPGAAPVEAPSMEPLPAAGESSDSVAAADPALRVAFDGEVPGDERTAEASGGAAPPPPPVPSAAVVEETDEVEVVEPDQGADRPESAAVDSETGQREEGRTGAAPASGPPPVPGAKAGEEGESSAAEGAPAPASGPPPVPPPAPATPPAPPAQKGRRKKGKKAKRFRKAWYEEFFDDDYLRTLPYMTEATTRKEVAYLRKELAVEPGARLLDVGCGYGRHAIELAAAGYRVTGLDTSLPLLIRAAELTREAGVEVNFVHLDMRELSYENEFDGAYCLMTSFGYFDDEANGDVLRRIHRALVPGGRFLLEVINRDYILPDLPSRVWWEGDDCVVMDEVEFNFVTSRIVSKRSVVFNDGRSINHDLSIRAYCLHELGRLLHQSGFRVRSVTGNMATHERFFGQWSPYLIILSEKSE